MIKYIKKGTKENNYIIDIGNKLPSNDIICKDILESIGNNTTKLILDKDIKNSYYVFLKDTIYISDKEKNKTGYGRICLIAHECIHSIQSKVLQYINFILSNIELLAFIIAIACLILNVNDYVVFVSYTVLTCVSIIPRLILEIDAIVRSVSLSSRYMLNKINKEDMNILFKVYKFQLLLIYPLFILSLLFGRMFRIVLIYLMYIY